MNYLSIIIPIHNEKEILEIETISLILALEKSIGRSDYEMILVENGSSDDTLNIARRLAKRNQQIKVLSMDKPDYGEAMKEGILQSKGLYSAVFNIDFWDVNALKTALGLMENEGKDIIVCSKTIKGSKDLRPLKRRFITRNFNFILRVFFSYKGTDTHGIKFFRTKVIIPIVKECFTGGGMFDTEVLLRAQYHGLQISEIPVVCVEREKRKSFFKITKHGPKVLKDLFLLFIRLRG